MPDSLVVFFTDQDRNWAEWVTEQLLNLGWNATLQGKDAVALTSPGTVYIKGSNSQRVLVPVELGDAGKDKASDRLAKEVKRVFGAPSPRDKAPSHDFKRFEPAPRDQAPPPRREARLPLESIPPPMRDSLTISFTKLDKGWAEWVREQLRIIGWNSAVQADDSGALTASTLRIRESRQRFRRVIVWVRPSEQSNVFVPGIYYTINISQVGEVRARFLLAEAVKSIFGAPQIDISLVRQKQPESRVPFPGSAPLPLPEAESPQESIPRPTLEMPPAFTPSPTIQTKASKRTRIFMSYSHKDKKWLKRLSPFLEPLQRDGRIDIWDDSRIKAGQQWRKEITEAIDSAKIVILLVSAEFMASDFINNDELPPILEAAEKRGVRILPVIVGLSPFEHSKLAQFQTINSPDQPLRALSDHKQDQVFMKVFEAVMEACSS